MVSTQFVRPVLAQEAPLRGPLNGKSANEQRAAQVSAPSLGGLSAPNSEAVMNQDMLLVKPSNAAKQPPEPLKVYINMGLKLQVDQRDIIFDKLRGVMITVTNQTNRPLVIDGTKAMALVGNKNYIAVPVAILQKALLPPGGFGHAVKSIGTKIIPAAITVGAVPAIKDMKTNNEPILARYGPDEARRQVESSRFGRRILWPRQKTQGILYFQTEEALGTAKINISATTLFDPQDTCTLSSAP